MELNIICGYRIIDGKYDFLYVFYNSKHDFTLLSALAFEMKFSSCFAVGAVVYSIIMTFLPFKLFCLPLCLICPQQVNLEKLKCNFFEN